MTVVAAAILDVVFLFEEISTSFVIWYATIDLENAFVNMDHQKQFAFGQQCQQYTFTVLPQGYINAPGICHNSIKRDLDYLSLENITLVYCIDFIMFIRQSVQG